ncbi:MAG: hypothetical protein KGQ66_13095 [Acidobacteriota bacterium]|nr:hypothetical protein [Acidobacteriota bacterium]
MSHVERRLPDVPGVGRRSSYGIDPSSLTAEERARLVVRDPYETVAGRVVDPTVTVEVPSRGGPGYRKTVPVVTEDQRRDLVRRVETGEWLLTATRPEWFNRYRSTQPRPHVTGHVEPLRADLARQATSAAAESANRNAARQAAQPAAPVEARLVYRSPFTS